MPYKVIFPATVEPITIEEARLHLRVDGDNGQTTHYDDALILNQLGAARGFVEDYLGYPLATQTVEMAFDSFPCCPIGLEGGKVDSITSVTYINQNYAPIVLDVGAYSLDDYSMPNWLVPAVSTSWPSTAPVVNAVKVRYVVGSEPLDKNVRAAILLMLGHLYENRENNSTLQTYELPSNVEYMLSMKRTTWGI